MPEKEFPPKKICVVCNELKSVGLKLRQTEDTIPGGILNCKNIAIDLECHITTDKLPNFEPQTAFLPNKTSLG